MGSSYRSDLRNGHMTKWEEKLRLSVKLIEEVQDEIYETIGSDGQFDNAADDGALSEKLGIAKQFILDELPKTTKH